MLVSQVGVIRCPRLCRIVKRTIEESVMSSTAMKKENRFNKATRETRLEAKRCSILGIADNYAFQSVLDFNIV